ncbi:MocR-like pyridoxine biosynthesis transcription factor PdxR [Anaeromicrobium sediminis]|uniref:GntR family transcriptional regulator n=1 Tax=Anaeromicrobium sediminis TaxID=1478221 RepID=A0A267M8M0_9FIRM|nr:PLP-dependent aminotransferase family protein [Anaeromicrobium sediminis]PAB55916.1 GntR family transcriptional regulator [Anaeromicrobium sediminis]
MRIKVDRDSKIALYIQIKNQIRDKIYSKVFPQNYILPSERELSDMIKVNRSTIIKAYQELKSEGLIASEVGKGTYVVYTDEIENNEKLHNFINRFYWDEIYSESSKQNYGDSISKIMKTDHGQRIISLSGGIPCPDSFPEEELKKIHMNLVENDMEKVFLHSPVDGYMPLKNEISNLLLNRGIKASPKEIMISSGSQQGLDLIVRTFINSGDVVLVEEPTFFAALQLFKTIGAKVIGVPIDNDGMRTDILKYLIDKHNPKCIYTIPTFQNPTGITMSMERRHELLNISSKYNVPIIEDDPYGELRYEGEDFPTLKALDRNNQVLYLSTFSKVIALGLRVGWIVAPEKVINKLSSLKQITDLHVNTLSQHTMYEFLKDGYYEKHVKRVKKEYLFKRNLMAMELQMDSLKECSFELPKGGYYIWYKVSNKLNSNSLIRRSVENGVNYMPGQLFYNKLGENNNYIRLNFTYPRREEIVERIKRLKDSIRQVR